MKKILVATAMLTLCSASAFAMSISNSKHNLSITGTGSIKASSQTQMCIYCHTPHNAFRNVPLWNRSAVAGTFQLYTSSNTLSNATKTSKLDQNSISIFCLSCHDGTNGNGGTAANITAATVYKSVTGNVTLGGAFARSTADLTIDGKSLTNDHPIGFSYGAAQGADVLGLNTAAAVSAGMGNKNVFYKSTAQVASDSMECSSCHAVHDNANSPFLRTNNLGSALCLVCHIK